jgi:large subunit ribosomal protein L4
MSAIVLNENFEKASEVAMPAAYGEINAHNLYLYVKSYQAALRANTASAKTRTEVSGGGKKPWGQKGRGGARAGSRRSPIFVGGGQAFGPSTNRNYNQKVNKKQKKLALQFALNELANSGKLFVVDSVAVESGKTKEAAAMLNKLEARDTLVVKENIDEMTFRAFRNLQNAYVVEANELNAFLASTFRSVLMEKAVFDSIVNEA